MPRRGAQQPVVIAFDLGGVVVDVDFGRVARALAVSSEKAEAAFFRDGLHDALTVGSISGAHFVATAAQTLGLAEARVAAAWTSMVEPLPDAAALIHWASTAATVVAWSNTDPLHAGALMPHLPLDRRASSLSFEIGSAKPHAAFFETALQRLGHPPAEVVFIDDRHDNVAAAQRAGVRAVQVDGVAAARAALAEFLAG